MSPSTLVAAELAVCWASSLIEMLGLSPKHAACVAARRYGVLAGDVLRNLPRCTSPSWRRGPRTRATSRPA
jgi:hypothetical protein